MIHLAVPVGPDVLTPLKVKRQRYRDPAVIWPGDTTACVKLFHLTDLQYLLGTGAIRSKFDSLYKLTDVLSVIVTLSSTKGLAVGFFGSPRMTLV
jgi:hypothetical protein